MPYRSHRLEPTYPGPVDSNLVCGRPAHNLMPAALSDATDDVPNEVAAPNMMATTSTEHPGGTPAEHPLGLAPTKIRVAHQWHTPSRR